MLVWKNNQKENGIVRIVVHRKIVVKVDEAGKLFRALCYSDLYVRIVEYNFYWIYVYLTSFLIYLCNC